MCVEYSCCVLGAQVTGRAATVEDRSLLGFVLSVVNTLAVYLALKSLAEQQPLKTVRFWGSCYVC